MNYTEHKPIAALANQVECCWFARSDELPATAPDRVLPDGCIEWIFHLGTPFRRLNRASEWEMQPRSFVVGELTRTPIVATAPAGCKRMNRSRSTAVTPINRTW